MWSCTNLIFWGATLCLRWQRWLKMPILCQSMSVPLFLRQVGKKWRDKICTFYLVSRWKGALTSKGCALWGNSILSGTVRSLLPFAGHKHWLGIRREHNQNSTPLVKWLYSPETKLRWDYLLHLARVSHTVAKAEDEKWQHGRLVKRHVEAFWKCIIQQHHPAA